MDIFKNKSSQKENRQPLLSLFLGMAVWFIDLNALYALPSLACKWGWFPFTVAGIPGLLVIEGIITLVSMLLMLYLIYLPWRNWRAYQTEKPQNNPRLLNDTEQNRHPMMAFIAMMLNSFFFLFIIAFFVPMITLNACIRG